MSVVIIDYGSGNLRSAAKAFERAVAEAGSTETVTVTADPKAVAGAGRVVLPGVGAFGDCMGGLAALPGMLEALDGAVIRGGKPFLGICVGMELMAEVGREHGDHAGLGWIPGEVAALAPADAALKIPHMGWNELAMAAPGHPVLAGIAPGAHAYFVHSYAFVCADSAHVLATVEYGGPVTAAVGRDNMIGTQFHPEKSQATGLKLITNFLGWRP
ncbi:MAG: imidazole glycerol phosphate synthase subunit HisH [Rhodospirillales bacterium]|jgi:glutamine amidotransferase|nr:imidazole glycerol phosphate synthase subunit HisH [Rhodospirillales bacterium]MDP6773767.1 imidazole glycerol phosphate synthase subunit HisH [Rhodospirillales bacterium]